MEQTLSLMIRPLRHFADFTGRSTRSEFFLFTAFNLVLLYALSLSSALAARAFGEATGGILAVVVALCWLALLIPALAVQVRRLHDQDRSGWLVLVSLLPLIGMLVLLLLMCLPGSSGANRFGHDPRG